MSDLEVSSDQPIAGREALVDFFRRRERRGRPRRVGVELELQLVRARDLSPIALRGPASVASLLARLASDGEWSERREATSSGERTIGLERPSTGDRVALEPGGQLELVTPPLAGASEIAARLRGLLLELSRAAADDGLWVLGGGLQPLAKLGELPRVEKVRYEIMRRHFAALGARARLAPHMMLATSSIQASFDWEDERDGALLLEASLRTAPALAALLASSPVEEGRLTRFRSRRLGIWRHVDPSRTGFVPPALEAGSGYDAYVEWALGVPLLLRVASGRYAAAGPGTFRDVLERGWPDGRRPTAADWEAHLTTIFAHARWKGVVEHRPLDGPLPEDALAVPALLVGLLEHRPSRDRALERLAWAGRLDLEQALEGAATRGLEARFGSGTLGDEARALLALARSGLEERVALGLEPAGTAELLAPLERRVEANRTPADDLTRAFARDGAAGLVERLRYDPVALAGEARSAA